MKKFGQTPALLGDMVHVWSSSLSLAPADITKSYTLLSADEKSRAEKKVFLKDRNRFIVARGILRNILSCYLGVNPVEIKFSYSTRGKPCLSDSLNCDGLSFNLSHSHNMALYALTLNRKVGVDLEYIRQDFDWNDIEGLFLSDTEKAKLKEAPKSDRCKVLYTYWTRKEAFLKSIGTGLAADPREISVLKQPGQSDWVMQPNQYIDSHSQWSLLDLNLGADYAASLVVEGTDFQIKYWKW